MSLFGSLMGDFEDDPFFGSHMQSMRQMNSMMNSMFADFGMMGPPMIGHNQNNRMLPMGQMGGMQMMPFGFPPMPSIGSMFNNMENMSQNPNCHSFTSSSIMTMTSSPDGRPQVYQESMSTRSGPGGIKETKKTVSDSRTGTRKMAIGHHIGERAHIIEREHNLHNGDQEEHQEFINLEEEEAESFNHEWQSKTSRGMGAIGAPNYRSHRDQETRQLALPSTATSSQHSRNHARKVARSARSSKSNNPSSSRSTESTSDRSTDTAASNKSSKPVKTTSRKREHSPEVQEIVSNKRQSSGSTGSFSGATVTSKTSTVEETQGERSEK